MAGGEGGLRVCGVEDVVDDEGIAAAGDVVEAATQREIVAEKVKAFFELDIERKIIGDKNPSTGIAASPQTKPTGRRRNSAISYAA